jgi:glycosyltransferase involved in cell wall biosynthesis
LPSRLSYPEIIPHDYHADVLYQDQTDLVDKLALLISNYARFETLGQNLAAAMERFAWENLIDQYDDMLEALTRINS